MRLLAPMNYSDLLLSWNPLAKLCHFVMTLGKVGGPGSLGIPRQTEGPVRFVPAREGTAEGL